MLDLIKNLNNPVHTYVDGFAASAATLLSLSGEKRFMTKNSLMLIHQLSSGFMGKFTEIKDENDNLDNTAGIAFNVKVGDQVNKGDSIMQCFGSDENKLDQAYSQLKETFQIAEEKVESQAMIFRD